MTARSKIIGLTRQIDLNADDLAMAEPNVGAEDAPPMMASDPVHDEYVESYIYEDDAPTGSSWTAYVLPSLLILAGLAWTGFFGWTYFAEAQSGLSAERAIVANRACGLRPFCCCRSSGCLHCVTAALRQSVSAMLRSCCGPKAKRSNCGCGRSTRKFPSRASSCPECAGTGKRWQAVIAQHGRGGRVAYYRPGRQRREGQDT